ncbi:uncharacterized protein LOC110849769 [Folsomia candida]|nr:uncharacterized protein LOC110849769 [Folsomia candida]XP_035707723.1 uncharacterized protein LOC110849769 [Folsomia candida]XP_035707724.1 uncharacterized protein LOC110849769 [Folsomia candida]XP_035707725.1 uncharacterized protein LOC110849769 [Folsomia candida]XP_035707726.1 uncharacterized protein LOC110849769 [Folsomia candida]XP_035707727.1 uncharacterized protein LOC110849769 [Folsomia candida]XP_035707728.1 uncharacterized protein LOC110849769 [Folsomia candida]XP_035707729.1 unc
MDVVESFNDMNIDEDSCSGSDDDVPDLEPSNSSPWTNKNFLFALVDHDISSKPVDYYTTNSYITPTLCGNSNGDMKFDEKNRVTISTMFSNQEKVINDKFFLCRTITPSFKMTRMMSIVEDPEGEDAVRLAIYNYSKISGGDYLKYAFPVGTILAVRNPSLKNSLDGCLALCYDDPNDVVIISEETFATTFPNIVWNGEIPEKYLPKKNPNADKVTKAKNSGNKAFVEKKYLDAIRFYTEGLEDCRDIGIQVQILSNRSAAFLQLGCYYVALVDATDVLKYDPNNVKGIYRRVRALWGIGRYGEALNFVNGKLMSIPSLQMDKVLIDLRKMGEEFNTQSRTGIYDMETIIMKSDPNPDLAEFMGALKITQIPGKGRGLVAKKAFSAGELLMCCKAFAHHKRVHPTSVLSIMSDNSFELVSQIAQKISLDVELRSEFYEHFPRAESSKKTGANEDADEISRLQEIVGINSFSNRENSGLWVLPSYFNHSCIGNAMWRIYGDMMFVRALKSISQGEEVLVAYVNPETDLEQRKAVFKRHKFTCSCLLCEIQGCEEVDGTKERRMRIMESIKRAADGNLSGKMVKKIFKLISDLESIQEACPRLNVFFTDAIFLKLSNKFYQLKMYRECMDIMEKIHFVTENSPMALYAVEASINILKACLLRQPCDRSLIKKWVKILKQDLFVAYGCLGRMRGSEMLTSLNFLGIDFFEG